MRSPSPNATLTELLDEVVQLVGYGDPHQVVDRVRDRIRRARSELQFR